jgi:hypothetical protein
MIRMTLDLAFNVDYDNLSIYGIQWLKRLFLYPIVYEYMILGDF